MSSRLMRNSSQTMTTMIILRPSSSDYLIIFKFKLLITLNMKKGGANTDVMRLQQQIM